MVRKKGKVYLVGAGPGDIGLLTLKGLRCLERADTIVYDFHINPQVLNHVKQSAEFIYAGKRGGHHEKSQEEINLLLVERAQQGRTVCRLKGGDPFVFGRGGEEAEMLSKAGVDFEVVPGVTSAIAVPAYAGIPLTHRDYASSFAVITGNEAAEKGDSKVYWSGLARTYDTLVFLMGVKNLAVIAKNLIENGKPPETPAAVIRWGTRPEQQTVVSTLGTIAQAVRDGNLRPPAIMIVGNVVKLRDTLKWYEEKPLFGRRILITRAYSREYGLLEELGAEIFEFPTIEIVPPSSFAELDSAIEQLSLYNWLLITSGRAFEHFVKRLVEKGRDIRDLKDMRICAIGTKTAETIARYGVRVDLIPDEFNAEGLVDAFLKLSPDCSSLAAFSFLLPRAEKARDLFPSKVKELGGRIATPPVYRSVKPDKHGKRLMRFLSEGKISLATFTSGATFNNFMEMMGTGARSFLEGVAIAVIGPVTKRAVEKAGFKVEIMPSRATISAMTEEIVAWAARGKPEDSPT